MAAKQAQQVYMKVGTGAMHCKQEQIGQQKAILTPGPQQMRKLPEKESFLSLPDRLHQHVLDNNRNIRS